MINKKFKYQCTNCGKIYSEEETKYLCPVCSEKNKTEQPPLGVLKTIYNYQKLIEESVDFKQLKEKQFLDILPIQSLESLPKLKVGNTPIYQVDELDELELDFQLFLKDDSQNTTYSFKDRASAIVSAYAKEKGWNTIVTASTGNAGSSLAGICANQKQQAIVMVPESAPLAKLTQILMYGAQIVPVKGTYDDAFDLSVQASEAFGWYNRNTAYNPLTIEGKKTVAFELFEQLGQQIPDRIFVPVGDGVIISGVYKGFEDLLKLNIIQKMPIIVAVQSEKSNNLIRNLNQQKFKIEVSHTLADSISVDIPRNFNMAQDFLKNYDGESISVSDEAILEASSKLSKNTGLFAEPAAAAAFAGLLAYQLENKLEANSKNMVLLTGSGLKDLKAVKSNIQMPLSIYPEIQGLKRLLKTK
jgi:threonine synthase